MAALTTEDNLDSAYIPLKSAKKDNTAASVAIV